MTIRHPSAAEARLQTLREVPYATTDEFDRIARQRALAHYLRRWHWMQRHIRVWRDMAEYDPRKAARVMYSIWVEVRLLDPQAARMLCP